ncbi:minor histocompatibility antigen h13 [Anaeramoeba flamelloides]|uniref:Minor histocompatibility antigen h13 n=1 Tax=Anaeramoeba flamelloides TaxID=1746091 RepID=A0AAV7Y3R9_9EUKA|nr:minor histocompatibility antigen h13 [Anaeramoeba flamelloides]
MTELFITKVLPYISLLGLGLTGIYAGAITSIHQFQEKLVILGETDIELSESETDDGEEDEEEQEFPIEESMNKKQASKYPLIAGSFLVGIFFALKLFGKRIVNLMFQIYFTFVGILTIIETFSPVFKKMMGKKLNNRVKYKLNFKFPWKIPYLVDKPIEIKETIRLSEIASLIAAILIHIWYFKTESWIANNILGWLFSYKGIYSLSLESFQTGGILLWGLFFYDTFFVFFTPVMVGVAKQLKGPIKFMFPRNIFADKLEFSMLGLGDIALPGIFIALIIKFDYENAKNNLKKNETIKKDRFLKPYFRNTFVGYLIGCIATVVVMLIFKAAQPALLYLVPGCFISSMLTAVFKGEFSKLFYYETLTTKLENKRKKEEMEMEKEKEKEKEKEGDEEKDKKKNEKEEEKEEEEEEEEIIIKDQKKHSSDGDEEND